MRLMTASLRRNHRIGDFASLNWFEFDTSSPGVRLLSLTFQLDCCTVTGTGITSEKGPESG